VNWIHRGLNKLGDRCTATDLTDAVDILVEKKNSLQQQDECHMHKLLMCFLQEARCESKA
jgi:hypothetical protein